MQEYTGIQEVVRVSTGATGICLLVVVDVKGRQALLTHIPPHYSVGCQSLADQEELSISSRLP